MARKARIFISSSSQPELNALRNEIYRLLYELGHEPVMYEKNFGPWAIYDRDSIYRCLRMVTESNIFLLFINNKAGSYLKKEKKTVTHLEFLKAFEEHKLILVFVEDNIRQTYFSKIKPLMDKTIAIYQKSNVCEPDGEILLEIAQKVNDKVGSPDIEPYTWLFIRDLVSKNIYCESFSLGVSVNTLIKDYLSDFLRGGSLLIPMENSIKENLERIAIYEELDELVHHLLESCHIGQVHDWRTFLTVLREKMKGGEIVVDIGEYLKISLGVIKDCSAITLYQKDGNLLKFIEKSGHARGENNYQLNSDSSFVSTTYNKNSECLFWREDKNIFYLTTRIRDLVMSFHFPYDSSWNKQKIIDSQRDILNGIMKIQGNALNLKLVKLILGGLPHEKK